MWVIWSLLAFQEMLNVQSVNSGIDISVSPLRSSGRRLLSGSKQEHHGRHSQGLPFLSSSSPHKVGNDLERCTRETCAQAAQVLILLPAWLFQFVANPALDAWTWPRLSVLKFGKQKLLILEVPVPLSPIGLLLEQEETHLVAKKPTTQPSTRKTCFFQACHWMLLLWGKR